jgi:hypothetical protein
MAQVDHDLTIVNCVDQQLRLIMNLGRHREWAAGRSGLEGEDGPARRGAGWWA